MKEYKVVSHFIPAEFEKLVSNELSQGWQLIGGVSVTSTPSKPGVYQIYFFQALAK